jgi:hypothetical protein
MVVRKMGSSKVDCATNTTFSTSNRCGSPRINGWILNDLLGGHHSARICFKCSCDHLIIGKVYLSSEPKILVGISLRTEAVMFELVS